MGYVFRLFTVVVLIAGPGAFSLRAADPAEKKDDTKLEYPQIPGANPKWDLKSVEESFTILKGGINDRGAVYFLVELKQDTKATPRYRVEFIDSDGVKFYTSYASCEPFMGKKGDRVRLIFGAVFPKNEKAIWAKATTVKLIED